MGLLLRSYAGSVTKSEFDIGCKSRPNQLVWVTNIHRRRSRPILNVSAADIFIDENSGEIRFVKFSVSKAAVWQQHRCFVS